MQDDELLAIDAYWRAANYLTVGQIYLLANPLLREPLRPEHIKPRLLGHWGTSPGLSLIYAHVNRVIRAARSRRHLPRRARATAAPRCSRTSISRAPTPRSIPSVTEDERGHGAAVPPVLDARRRTESRRSDDAGLDPRGWRARLRAHPRVRRGVRQPRSHRGRGGRRRRSRDRAARGLVEGHQVPQRRTRRRGAAGASPQRLQDRRARPCSAARATSRSGACSRVTATTCTSSTATIRCAVHRALADDARHLRRARSRRSRTRRARAASAARPLAGDRAAHAEGLDRTRRRSNGLPVEGTFRAHQVPLAAVRTDPEQLAALEAWMRSYRPEELFDARGRLLAGRCARSRPPAPGGWAPIHTRTAACSAVALDAAEPPRLRDRRPAAGRRPRTSRRARSARCCATSTSQNPTTLPPGLPRRDQLEPARRGVRRRDPLLPGAGDRDRRSRVRRGPRDGGAERAQLRGLARGLRADRPPRPVRDLRGVRADRRVDDDPAREVARDDRAAAVARAGAVAQLPADVDVLAQRPQRLLATRARASWTRSRRRRARSRGSTCRPMPTACSRSPITACAAATTSTSSSSTSSRSCSGSTLPRRASTARGARRSGSGPAPSARRRAGCRPGVRRRRADARDHRRGRVAARRTRPRCGCAWSTSSI